MATHSRRRSSPPLRFVRRQSTWKCLSQPAISQTMSDWSPVASWPSLRQMVQTTMSAVMPEEIVFQIKLASL